MKSLLTLLVALCFSLPAWGQGSRRDAVAAGPRGIPIAGASVAVCTEPANTTTAPCTPLATLYADLDHLIEDAPDHLFALVYDYANKCGQAKRDRYGMMKWPKPSDELIKAMYEHFKAAISDSFTTKDSRQHELDI